MPKALRSGLLIVVLSLLLAPSLHAELLWSNSGFYVDLPEGFQLQDGDGKTRFSFVSPDGAVEYDLFSYEPGRYASAQALSEDAVKKLGSTGEREGFSYQGRASVFAELNFRQGQAQKLGYAVFIGPDKGGKTFALLAFGGAESVDKVTDFILSCLDSFSVDKAATRAPGPVSQYLLAWPADHKATKLVQFGPGLGNASAELPWSDEEEAQESDTAAREFRVLQAYATVENLAYPAWRRAYRMIYRESAARLDRLALEMDRLLPEDPTDAARKLLAWTQGFVYERNQAGMDFVPPLAAAYEGRGDCDSRAMVAAIILERRGIDAILMVSEAYSHALLGVDVPGGGQRFAFDGKNYLVGETTAKVGLGMIAADQADWKKWIGIQLGEK